MDAFSKAVVDFVVGCKGMESRNDMTLQRQRMAVTRSLIVRGGCIFIYSYSKKGKNNRYQKKSVRPKTNI